MNGDDKTKTEPQTETRNQPTAQPAAPQGPSPEDVRREERARVAELLAIGGTFHMAEAAQKAIEDGTTAADFRKIVLDEQARKADADPVRSGAPNVLVPDNQRRYSVRKAILAMLPNVGTKVDTGYEREVSQEMAKQAGQEPRGIYVNMDLVAFQRQSRDFNQTTGTGSNLIATNLLTGQFIEMLRNTTLVMKAGATTLPGLVGNVGISKQTGAGTAYWFDAESADITAESNPTVGQVSLSPKHIGAYTDISRELLLQATPAADTLVENDLRNVIALGVDLAALTGSGTGANPTGIINTSGIGGTTWATANAPTFTEMVAMETEISTDNALDGTLAYAMGSGLRGTLKTTVKAAGQGGFVFESDNTVNGYTAHHSNQLAAGRCIYGNWADLLIGMWGGLDITLDNITNSLRGGLRIIMIQSVDIQVRNAVSFAYNRNSTDT